MAHETRAAPPVAAKGAKSREFSVDGVPLTASPPAPGLYLVATPIGNLADISLRALRILAGVDSILCEDTRVTRRLTERYAIAVPLSPYHDHNAARVRPGILRRLADGAALALVSDAGTPLVSDPGYKLVGEALDAGVPVHAVPGPSAVLAALTVAGLPSDRFLFAGFLPSRQGERRTVLDELAGVPATLVFYEAPSRLARALADMAEVLGDRPAAIARELTKLHEETVRDTLAALAARFAEAPRPKGEIVVVVSPPGPVAPPGEHEVDELLAAALAAGSVKQAAREVADATGLSRRELYARAVALQRRAAAPSGADDA